MNIAVIRFPGSNCDQDAYGAAARLFSQHATYAWHKESELPAGTDSVIVPGGFSYGDYLRCGAMAATSPIMGALRRFAEQGGPVLGICNGFQILTESRLLDGALTRNSGLRFLCRDVFLRVEGRPTPFTSRIGAGTILKLPIAHAEGRFVHLNAEGVETSARVIFRYCDAAGGIQADADVDATDSHIRPNPNGSVNSIAGICNERGNVVGLMPHPERACEALLGSADGRRLFESLIEDFAHASAAKSGANVGAR